MADESIQNGTNGGDVPEIELIIKVRVRKYWWVAWALLYVISTNGWARKMAEQVISCPEVQ
jgi:hypothetical protein